MKTIKKKFAVFFFTFFCRWISIGNVGGGGEVGVVKLSTATNTFFLHTSNLLSLALSLSPPFHRRAWLCVCAFLFFLFFFANAARLSLSLQLQHSSLLLREGGRQLSCCGCWLRLITKNKTIKKNIHPICNNLCCSIRTHTHHNSFDFFSVGIQFCFCHNKKIFLAEATQTRRVAKMC